MDNKLLEEASAELLNNLRDAILKDSKTGEYLDQETRARNLVAIFERINEMSEESFNVPDFGKRKLMYDAMEQILKEIENFVQEHNSLVKDGK